MNRIAAFAAPILLAFTAAATAQQAPGQHPPLLLNDDTVAVIRNDQAGTLTLPQGRPPFPAVILMHGCGGVTQNMNV